MIKIIKGILTTLFVAVAGIGFSQVAPVIQFEENNWEEVLALAKNSNKIIFIDAYTDWCVPCKEMDKRVFTSHRLGSFFNEHFINAKVNMEKGLGPALAIRYDIGVFPSLLFLTPDGTMIHRLSGYQNTDRLMNMAYASVKPSEQMAAWEKRYLEGDRHPDFMRNYFMASYKPENGSHIPLIDEYFISQKNWSTESNIRLLFQFIDHADDPKFDYLIDNKDRFIEVLGKEEVVKNIEVLTSNKLFNSTPEISLSEAEHLFNKVFAEEGGFLYSEYRMRRHLINKEYTMYANYCVEHDGQFPTANCDQLNYMAWQFYEHVDGDDHLKFALQWAKKSADLKASYYNHDTIAALYYKMKNKRKAKKYAKKAIKLAMLDDVDPKESLALLEKIKQM